MAASVITRIHPASPALGRVVEDLLIRLGGLAAILLAGAALDWLYRLIHIAGPREATPGQLLLAAIGFLGASIGTGLLILGRHIHDEVELSDRWRPRR